MIDRLRELVARMTPSGSVLDRTIKGGIWMTGIKVTSRALEMLMLVVLARLLAPRQFGLLGIALLTLSAMKKFTEIGLNAALVQHEDENINEYLNTTWCLEVGRGLLIFGTLFVAAPYVAAFFGEPRATNLLRVIGLAPLMYGLRNPGAVYFQKDLAFHKEFVYRLSGSVSQFAVGIGYALVSPTVWALVFAFVAKDAGRSVASYVIHDYRPWPSFDREYAAELIDYGKWITGTSILYFIYSEGDDAFVGWFLSATALGFYQYAYRMADTPSTEVSEVIESVTFPAYSKLQNDVDELRAAVLKTTRVTAFIAFPMSLGIAAITPSFVPVVLGEDWTPMVLTMQLLAMYGLMHAITRNYGAVWKAVGRPDYITKLGALRVLCIAVLIWPATARWGIEGTALVVTGVYVFPMMPLDLYLISKVTEGTIVQYLREFFYPGVAATVMFGVLWYVHVRYALAPLVELVVFIPAGAVVYFATAMLLELQFDWGIERNLRTIVGAIRR